MTKQNKQTKKAYILLRPIHDAELYSFSQIKIREADYK